MAEQAHPAVDESSMQFIRRHDDQSQTHVSDITQPEWLVLRSKDEILA
ncbi:hypothetical protein [Actinoallomurus soli]|nr:hypothetical protein [Actinoallomurus soli]MCO5973136.1 hypothetical protein [Actinoallomurus soli]